MLDGYKGEVKVFNAERNSFGNCACFLTKC